MIKRKAVAGEDEGGLGNLPPLSDFDSSDSGLPPLGSLSDSGGKGSIGGLPPIGDIRVETPVPSGGAIKPPPPGFEMEAEFETPTFETPGVGSKIQGFKSSFPGDDFNPETPEIGAGEPSLDTPMFDSAFGGGGWRRVHAGLSDPGAYPSHGDPHVRRAQGRSRSA